MTRSNAPFGGIASPWTRPVDVVIAAFTQLQPASIDIDTRLIRAALLMPLLAMALLLFGLCRNMKFLVQLPSAPFMVMALVATCVPMWNYLSAGNADHHGLLAACFVWAMGCLLADRPSPPLVIVSGVLFALHLWISPEAILLIAIVYGWYMLLWLKGDMRAYPWKLLATSIAAGSAIALMIERPYVEWLTPIYDSISIVYVAMLFAVAAGVWAMSLIPARTVCTRLALGAVSTLPLAYVLFAAFPLMRKGAMAEAAPYIMSNFLPRITEAQSLLATTPLHIVAMLAQPIMAVVFLRMAWRRKKSIFSDHHLAQLSYLLLAVGVLYLTQQRFYYYFYPIVVLILAPLLASLLTPANPAQWPSGWIIALSPNAQMVRRLPLMILILGLPMLLLALVPKASTEDSRAIEYCHSAARRLIYSGELATIYGSKPVNLFVSTDLGGEVLFFTPHRIIASNYHREGVGIRYIWEADTITDPTKLRRYLADRRVEALLLCPVVKSPEASVLQRLRSAELRLTWAKPIAYDLPKPEGAKEEEMSHRPALFLVR